MTLRSLGGREAAAAALLVSLLVGFLAVKSPLVAVALMIGIVFITWIALRPELVLITMIAALPWDNWLDIPNETLSMVKILGLALVAAYLFRVARRKEQVRGSAILGFAFAFGLVAMLSLVASPEVGAGAVKFSRYAFFILFLFLAIQLVRDRQTGVQVMRFYVLSAAIAGLVGLIGFLAGQTGRAAGPIEDPNDFGYLMATVMPLAVYLYREDHGRKALWAFSIVCLVGGTAATLSRGALVGLTALMLWLLLTGRIGVKRTVFIVTGVVALIAVGFILFSSTIETRLEEKNHIAGTNVESRTSFWNAAIEMASDHPLLGVGPGRFGIEEPKYVFDNPEQLETPIAHNTYLEILAESGPFALVFFGLMLFSAWVSLSVGERLGRQYDDPLAVNFAAAVKGSLIVACVSGIFLSEQVAAPIWLACALAASGAVLSKRKAARKVAAPAVLVG
jgi:putative inorganic carbon (hco3(-)) transporter